jgi:hypothetical protein
MVVLWDSLVKQCKEMCPLTASNRHISFLGALISISLSLSECLEKQHLGFGSSNKSWCCRHQINSQCLTISQECSPLVTVEYCFCPNTRPSSQFPGVWGNCHWNHAVVACNGAILKGNATASVDGYLAAAISCHELMLAAELVCLVVIHGGVAHTRSALLKSHTIKAWNVQLTSFLAESLGDRCYDKRSGATCKTDVRIHTNLINRKHRQNSSGVSTSMGTSEILLQSSSERCHASAIIAVALFVLKVLCAIPIEIRVFAAETLFPQWCPVLPLWCWEHANPEGLTILSLTSETKDFPYGTGSRTLHWDACSNSC